MMDVAHFRAILQNIESDEVVFSKDQVGGMLDEIETGQKARRALTNLSSIVTIAASASGMPA